MSKLIKAFCLTVVLSVCSFAQTTNDEYNKNEFYVGYSNQRIEGGSGRNLHGIEGAYVRNFSRYFGIKGDVSATYKNSNFSATIGDPITGTYSYRGETSNSRYNFLGGVQIKDNATQARFKPFGHALAGIAHNRSKVKNITCVSGTCPSVITNPVNSTFSDTGFSGAFGGGLDIKINDKIDFRAIQVDYNPVYTNSRVENNVRFGVGIVFK